MSIYTDITNAIEDAQREIGGTWRPLDIDDAAYLHTRAIAARAALDIVIALTEPAAVEVAGRPVPEDTREIVDCDFADGPPLDDDYSVGITEMLPSAEEIIAHMGAIAERCKVDRDASPLRERVLEHRIAEPTTDDQRHAILRACLGEFRSADDGFWTGGHGASKWAITRRGTVWMADALGRPDPGPPFLSSVRWLMSQVTP